MSTPTPLTNAIRNSLCRAPSSADIERLLVLSEQLETSLAQAKADMLDAQSARDKAQMDTVTLLAKCGDLTQQLAAERALSAKGLSLLGHMLNVAENCDETGYVADAGFVDIENLHAEVRALLAATPASAASELAAGDAETFPILGFYSRELRRDVPPDKIPWAMIAPHDAQAKRNHCGQSLDVLASRGGLSPQEAVSILEDHEYAAWPDSVAISRLKELVANWPTTSGEGNPADRKPSDVPGVAK